MNDITNCRQVAQVITFDGILEILYDSVLKVPLVNYLDKWYYIRIDTIRGVVEQFGYTLPNNFVDTKVSLSEPIIISTLDPGYENPFNGDAYIF
jgi:hypothetical protein